MKFGKTGRGYRLLSFTDRYRKECSLQESSTATEGCVWLGIDDPDPQIMVSDAKRLGILATEKEHGWARFPIPDEVVLSTRMHLTQMQVSQLLPSLQYFVSTSFLPESEADLKDFTPEPDPRVNLLLSGIEAALSEARSGAANLGLRIDDIITALEETVDQIK